jgi:hypothetical protein
MSQITKRLSRTGYNRPTKTYQDTLTSQDIKDKLKEYKKVTDIKKVSIGTHLRYFTINKKGEQLFRLGGVLTKYDPEGRFIILSNGDVSWSVQIQNTIFFQKMTETEIREEVKKEMIEEIMTEELGNTDYDLKKQIKILTKKIENYEVIEKKYISLIKKNEKLTEQLKNIELEIKKEKSKRK